MEIVEDSSDQKPRHDETVWWAEPGYKVVGNDFAAGVRREVRGAKCEVLVADPDAEHPDDLVFAAFAVHIEAHLLGVVAEAQIVDATVDVPGPVA